MRSVADQNIAEQVVENLRAAIHSGELAPGSRLVERKLADRLGVSHIPVREALTRLAEEGLIIREPRRGARVAELTVTDLEEISSLRIILEQFMTIRVQERWTPDSAARLSGIVDAMSRAEPGDTEEILRQDRLFHETLAELAEHRLLTDLNTQLRGRVAGFLLAANASLDTEMQAEHVRSHRIIVDAIESRDPELARNVISEHIVAATKRILPLTAQSVTDDPDGSSPELST